MTHDPKMWGENANYHEKARSKDLPVEEAQKMG
jgi:hypothetical protein